MQTYRTFATNLSEFSCKFTLSKFWLFFIAHCHQHKRCRFMILNFHHVLSSAQATSLFNAAFSVCICISANDAGVWLRLSSVYYHQNKQHISLMFNFKRVLSVALAMSVYDEDFLKYIVISASNVGIWSMLFSVYCHQCKQRHFSMLHFQCTFSSAQPTSVYDINAF